MTNGLLFDPSGPTLEILDGSRVVYQLGSQMVEMLTTEETFSSVSVAFADLSKDNLVIWEGHQLTSGAPPWNFAELSVSYISAIPQESDVTQDLMDVPTGADFFAGRLKLSQTAGPDQWQSRDIPVLPPQDVWMPFFGGASWLLEAEFGMARMLHLYIDAGAGKLRIGKQQSVSVAPGGASGSGGTTDQWHHSAASHVGMPVHRIAQKTDSYSGFAMLHSIDRSGSPPSLTDTTDYSSTYSVDIVGRFGRRTY